MSKYNLLREFPLREQESATKETRTWAQKDAIAKRSEMHRQVGIKRLRQQGLSQFEAEEQYGSRMWSRV